MSKNQITSLQERIVNEITSTYNSIATYKDHTSKGISRNKIHGSTADRRIQIVEHKLKALKMMLAKIDDNGHSFCEKCHKPILSKKTRNHFCINCS